MWQLSKELFHSINWSAVAYVSWLLFWSSLLVTALYVGLMHALNTVEKLSMRSDLKNFVNTWLKWRMRSARARRLLNRWIPRVGMMVVGYFLGQAELLNPVREFHLVEVIQKVDSQPDRFLVFIPKAPINAAYKQDATETWKVCERGDQMPWKAGVLLLVVQFKQGRDCQLFDKDTEVKYYQNKDHRVVSKNGAILYAKGE
jgi:hypothetical protein